MRLESPTSIGTPAATKLFLSTSSVHSATVAHEDYFSKYKTVEKAYQTALDITKLCRDILNVAQPPSEDEVEISHKIS